MKIFWGFRISERRLPLWKGAIRPGGKILKGSFLSGIHFNESSYYFDEFKRKLVLRKDAIPQVHTGHAENSTPVLGELEVDDTETNDIITVVSDCEMKSIIETNAVEETAIEITNDNLLLNNDFLLRAITLGHSYAAKPDDYFTLRNENHKLKSNFKKAQRKSILCISKLMQSNKKKSKELLAMSLKLRKSRSTLITQESFTEDAKEIFRNELRNRKRLPKNREFSKRLVDIACIQKFHSNSGYENLRIIFSFPCPRTLRRKTEKIDCSPGYQENICKHTKQQITENLLDSNCIMSIDEMAIHKSLDMILALKISWGTQPLYLQIKHKPKKNRKLRVKLCL